jgi:hypothetical protein
MERDGSIMKPLTLETKGTSYLVKPTDPHMAYGRIKVPFRKVTGDPAAIVKGVKNYFEKLKKSLQDNRDKLTDKHLELIGKKFESKATKVLKTFDEDGQQVGDPRQFRSSALKWVKGTSLSSFEQKRALGMFNQRFTGDHKPSWADKEWKDGKPYPLQFKDDKEWLANTEFPVTKDGKISNRHRFCRSNPTWPDNPELRK